MTTKRPLDPNKLQRNLVTGRLPGDESCNLTFFRDAVFSPYESELKGEEVWSMEDFIRITVPGDNKTVILRQINNDDIARFHPEYFAYKEGIGQDKKGLPLRQWPVLEKSIVIKLETDNIDTVEELASLSDADAGKYLNGLKNRDRARAHIDQIVNAEKVKLAEAKEAELLARIAALEAAAKPAPKTAKAE